MDTKIQELTEKIYKEGVEKGNLEAEQIISDAKSQKEVLISEAKAEANQIIATAQKNALEFKKNAEAELKLFASQTIEALKSEVTNLITGSIVTDNVKAALVDPAFMQQVMVVIAKTWAEKEIITIQTTEAEALTKYFEANAKDLLSKGLKIEKVNAKEVMFNILPMDGSYKVTFGEAEFVAFFKEFLRPQLVEMLF